MDFKIILNNINQGAVGYAEIADSINESVDLAMDAIEKLSDDAWHGLSQEGYLAAFKSWIYECTELTNSLSSTSEILNNKLSELDSLLKKGQNLDI